MESTSRLWNLGLLLQTNVVLAVSELMMVVSAGGF